MNILMNVVSGGAIGMDLTGVTTAVSGAISVGDVVKVIAASIGAGGTIYVTWTGARKLLKAVTKVFRGGNLTV